MGKGYLIPHTHWDREWRYPIWENRMYLVELIDSLFETLEKNPGYKSFLFDGQTISIRDYLEVRPENTEKMKQFIREGRIVVGPWYTLPDLYPVSGESLVRNLLKGERTAKELGGCLKIGYESFGWGQTAQFPQIYKGFGIDTVVVAKNVDKSRAPHCEFIWEGADGTKVFATRLGNDARANFFMNAYLEIMNGMPYKEDAYRYRMAEQGMAFHEADQAGYIQDHFMLESSEKIHTERITEAVMKAWKGMDATLLPEHRAMMNGSDSTTPQPKMMELIAAANEELKKAGIDIELQASSIQEYVELLKTIPTEQLPVVQGELRDGPATSLSANALMTRPYIKMLNKSAQNMLFGCAEPFSVAGVMLGNKYDKGFLDKAIDYLLLSHPHDSINGVTQDKTVDDVMYSLNQSLEISKTVYHQSCKNILKAIDTGAYAPDDVLLVIFNPLPFSRSEVIQVYIDTPRDQSVWDFVFEDAAGNTYEPQIVSHQEVTVPVSDLHARPWPNFADRHSCYLMVSDIPAGGYKVLKLIPKSSFNRNAAFWPLTRKTAGDEIGKSTDVLENEFLHVKVNANGTVSLTDKRSGKQYPNLNYFEDTGDVGDYWIYFPPYHNQTYSSKGCQAKIWTEDNGPLSATVAARIEMELPAYGYRPENAVRGESRRSDETKKMPVTVYYTLKKGSDQLDVRLEVENTIKDHRFRVLFDTGVSGDTAYAQGHFNVDERPYLPLKDQDGKYYNELTTQPMQDFIDLTDGKENGFGIVSDSMIEYEAMPNQAGTLALTLFRAVQNIICTEMRSGGVFPDQDGGQSLRKLTYRYAICPHKGDYRDAELYRRASELNIPLKPIQTSKQLENGYLPAEYSFYQVEGLTVSCLKKCEDSDSYILRLYNPSRKHSCGKVRFASEIKKACLTDLDENVIGTVDYSGNTLTVEAASNQIITVRFCFA